MSDVEAVRDATDLVALVTEHIRLEPKGREHVGLCPFHDDSRPSFAVVTHLNTPFYKCFACGASGDCFTFLQKHLNWSFPEALQHLAEKAGITLAQHGNGDRDAADRSQKRRKYLRTALDRADTWFRDTLHTPAGEAARNCIARRGISTAMVERFGLGVAPEGWQHLHEALCTESMPSKVLVAAGLLKEKDGGRCYDTFRNRLMFPIHDDAGQPVAFGGRDLGDDGPKYLNSPEHDLFKKGRTLYGMHLARQPMRTAGRAIVAEGYTDVIACHSAGFTETVGTLGTAFTDDHARILQRNTNVVVLLFDGDEAGRKAADRAVGVSMRHVLDVKICVLPDNTDPDDLLGQADGLERFTEAIEQSMDAITWSLDRSGIAQAAPGSADRQQRLQRLLDDLTRNGLDKADAMRREFILSRIAELAGVPASVVRAGLQPTRTATRAPSTTPDPASDNAPIERELLAVGLAALSHELPASVVLEDMHSPMLQAIATAALTLIQQSKVVDIPHLHDQLPSDELRHLATELVEMGHAILQTQLELGDDAAVTLDRLVQRIARRRAAADTSMKIDAWRGKGDANVSDAAKLIEEIRATGRRPDAMPRPVEN